MARKCRIWLKRNKIYFETVTATLLAGMAIVVGYEANRISAKQTELLSLQTEILEQQSLPQFVIKTNQIYDSSSKFYEDEEISVKNVGAILKEFTSGTAIFYQVELYHKDPRNGEPIDVLIPINGYFGGAFYSSEGLGTVVRYSGEGNNRRSFILEKSVRELADLEDMFCTIQLRIYLKLNYSTMLGERLTEYYIVQNIHGGWKLDSEEGERIFQIRRDVLEKGNLLNFDTCSAEDIFITAKEHARK